MVWGQRDGGDEGGTYSGAGDMPASMLQRLRGIGGAVLAGPKTGRSWESPGAQAFGTSGLDPGMWDKFNVNFDPFTSWLQKEGGIPTDPVSNIISGNHPFYSTHYLREGAGGILAPGQPRPMSPSGAGAPGAASAPLSGPPTVPGTMGMGGTGGGGVGKLEGLDFTKPGALEQFQREMGGYFQQPTLSETFAKNALAQGAGPAVTNRSEEAFQQFQQSTPANMDPFYENERRKAMEAINKTMAARGSYGSSAANDMIGEAFTNLAADAAKANAQYGLQRGSLMGSLAQGADSSSLAGSSDRRNWMGALGDIAGRGDHAGLERIIGGANVAGAAQGAQRTRGQDAFQNQLQMGDRMSGIMGAGYGNLFGSDMSLLSDIIGLRAGIGAEGYGQASQRASQARQDVNNFNSLLAGNMQFGRGLADMFGGTGSGQPAQSPMPTTPPQYGSGINWRPYP